MRQAPPACTSLHPHISVQMCQLSKYCDASSCPVDKAHVCLSEFEGCCDHSEDRPGHSPCVGGGPGRAGPACNMEVC